MAWLRAYLLVSLTLVELMVMGLKVLWELVWDDGFLRSGKRIEGW